MKTVSILLLIGLTASCAAATHDPGEDMTTIELGKGKVTIHYGTPKLNGRSLDDMIKPGLAWFMGMNFPTTLETTATLDFDGKKLPPGKYAIFARADEHRNWTLLISSAIARQFDPSTVVLEAPLRFTKDGPSQELLKFTLEKTGSGASMVVAWGTYRLQRGFSASS
ncbi:MAG TPA: DUF2911 domain-containing protein [Blastocatellia bacterium]|nr:DUF2911 domain-containing protein [Blastocatellia bacterium]